MKQSNDLGKYRRLMRQSRKLGLLFMGQQRVRPNRALDWSVVSRAKSGLVKDVRAWLWE